ncbi:hypothetical protein LSM04_006284 [Trypanosoma melophagium]|uniref:uncharacterized protein n=1 Tax=Trypanosoma melophagium TaxID=715481 RepID=UPI00351A66DA|nr:hypothetical protein LSM04_006284 [Trypanosoma melophagium]
MDEASALVAWGRQVLANRRLQKQRERLEREQQKDPNDSAAPFINPLAANRINTSWSSIDRELEAQPFLDELAFTQRSTLKGGTSPQTRENKNATIEETVEVAQLRRRVDLAKQTLRELLILERRNEEKFQHRREELQRLLEQNRLLRHNGNHHNNDNPSNSAEHSQKEAREEFLSTQKALLKRLHDEKVEGAAVAAVVGCASNVRNWNHRVFQSLREVLHGWRLHFIPALRQFCDFLQKLPALPQQMKEEENNIIFPHRCNDMYPMMNVSGDYLTGVDVSSSWRMNQNDDNNNNNTKNEKNIKGTVEEHSSYNGLMASKRKVALPTVESYPELKYIDTLPVQEAIDVIIHALVKAGKETVTCLSYLIDLSDRKDASLLDLLTLSEKHIKEQQNALEEAHDTLEKLHDEKNNLEVKGVKLSDELEELQQKILTLKLQRDQDQHDEKERTNELQSIRARINEVKQKLEQEASLRNESLQRTEEARDRAERAGQQKAILEIQIQEMEEEQRMLESELLTLRRTARHAKEEEDKSAELLQEHFNEFRVCQSSLHTARKFYMDLREKHEKDRNELVTLRCRIQELKSQIANEEMACDRVIVEMNIQRGVEAAVREELASVRIEERQLRSETAALRISLRRAEAEQTEAEAKLLYHRQLANDEVPKSTTGAGIEIRGTTRIMGSAPPTQRSLAEVLLEAKSENGNGPPATVGHSDVNPSRGQEREEVMCTTSDIEKEWQRPNRNNNNNNNNNNKRAELQRVLPTHRGEAAEVTLKPRVVEREQEELAAVQSHSLREQQRQQEEEPGMIAERMTGRRGRSSINRPSMSKKNDNGGDDEEHHEVPLIVSRPSRREMYLNFVDEASELYYTRADPHGNSNGWVG